jgi:hypothetical protein
MLSGLAMATGCAAESLEDPELNAQRQQLVDSTNGMRTINGLSTINGLRTLNGLSVRNGLRTLNGLTSINGLRTLNGLKTINGLSVDCTGKTLGVDCTGEPDGLLSAATGLLSSDLGLITAKYLVRCALPASESLRVVDYTGGLISLVGESGVAPEWADGQCSTACEEKISSCLMALTNGAGNHVQVELSQNDSAIGGGHSYPYQEAAFYGNVFSSPPKAFFCVGKDFTGFLGTDLGSAQQRACSGYSLLGASCPYVKAGNCSGVLLTPGMCSFSNSSADSCKSGGGLFSSSTTWNYPMTTYRLTKGAT